jgi:hypothetical protein
MEDDESSQPIAFQPQLTLDNAWFGLNEGRLGYAQWVYGSCHAIAGLVGMIREHAMGKGDPGW